MLSLEGVHNFRDFGGYAVAGGGRLRRGLLWRSGQHHGATQADLAKIAALKLASVFDLRSLKERTAHPCRRPKGFDAEIFTIAEPTERAAPHVAAAQATVRQRDAASAREAMRRNYETIAFRPALVEGLRTYLRTLGAGKGASLINCMAGKDRTGISVAVAQLAAGVHRDDVLADYLLTATAGDPEARIAAGMQTMRAVTGPLDEAVMRVLMGVEAEYLETAFAAMAEQHGSVDGYLREVVGLDDGLKDRLRGALVE